MTAKARNKKEKDLFEDYPVREKEVRRKTTLTLPHFKKTLVVSYENVIFLAIAFIMGCIIFFSFGVEKGRQDVIGGTRQHGLTTGHSAAPGSARGTGPVKPAKQKKKAVGYTIQIAAFKERQSARQERDALRKEGYRAGVKKSGTYYQVYVGAFKEKRGADSQLEKLKQKYNDCYIKKIEEE